MKKHPTAGSIITSPRFATAALAVALALNLSDAQAFGFGTPEVASSLGQNLQMRIPLRVDPEIELTSQCVRLLANSEGDATPALTMAAARLTLEIPGAQSPALRIESVLPVNEPVLNVTVEIGCAQRVRRQFTLLLDPPGYVPQVALALAPAQPVDTRPPVDLAHGQAEAALTVAATPAETAEAPLAVAPTPAAAPAEPEAQNPQTAANSQQPSAPEDTAAGSGAVDSNCLQLADAMSGSGAPVLNGAGLNPAQFGTGTTTLAASQPVTDPALRAILDVGCKQPVRSESGVQLEAPATAATVVRTDAGPGTASPQPVASAAQGPLALAAPAAAAAAAPAPEPAKPKRKGVHLPAAAVATASTVAPTASAALPSAKPEKALPSSPAVHAAQKPAAPARKPGTDRLTLSGPENPPAVGDARLAEMQQRVEGLTKELGQLRAELDAANQRRLADADSNTHPSGFAWVAAVLALIGVGVGSFLGWRRRSDQKPRAIQPSWNTIVRAADRPPPTTVRLPASDLPKSAAKKSEVQEGPVTEPGLAASSTDAHASTRIEVTELHDLAQSMDQLHTLFHDSGAAPSADAAVPHPAIAARAAPAYDQPPMPMPTLAHTQTPTEISLDLDLSSRALPDGEAAADPLASANNSPALRLGSKAKKNG